VEEEQRLSGVTVKLSGGGARSVKEEQRLSRGGGARLIRGVARLSGRSKTQRRWSKFQ
jgi:hypothetical protein